MEQAGTRHRGDDLAGEGVGSREARTLSAAVAGPTWRIVSLPVARL